MTASVSAELLVGFLLAMVRASAWVLVSPPFNTRLLPPQAKIALALAVSVPVGPRLAALHPSLEPGPLVGAVVLQVAAGLALGFVTQIIFSAIQAAGELIDLFASFTIAATYDPFTNNNQAVFGRFYQLLAMALLFSFDGHLLLVRGFMDSFTAMPTGWPDMDSVTGFLLRSLGMFFVSALEIAAPVVAALFLTEVALGLLSKAAPAMNVFTLGFPLKILLTFGLVGLALPLLPGTVDRLVRESVRTGGALVGAFS
jgi:flagellar biosynthetic protein FliR